MSQFNERFEEESMNTFELEVGKLYGIKCKDYNELLNIYRNAGRDFTHNKPNEVVYVRVVRKYGGSIKPRDEITEEFVSILTERWKNSQAVESKSNALWSVFTNDYIVPYQNLAYYQLEIVEGIPFPKDGDFDSFTGYWINTKGRSFHKGCYFQKYTLHEEILHTAGMFKNAAVVDDDDDEDD
jgi:hypothetical protein